MLDFRKSLHTATRIHNTHCSCINHHKWPQLWPRTSGSVLLKNWTKRNWSWNLSSQLLHAELARQCCRWEGGQGPVTAWQKHNGAPRRRWGRLFSNRALTMRRLHSWRPVFDYESIFKPVSAAPPRRGALNSPSLFYRLILFMHF